MKDIRKFMIEELEAQLREMRHSARLLDFDERAYNPQIDNFNSAVARVRCLTGAYLRRVEAAITVQQLDKKTGKWETISQLGGKGQ